MLASLAWIDGRLTRGAAAEALAGEGRGIALLETLRLDGGRITFLEAHLERLKSGARSLELDWPTWDPAEALFELAAALLESPAPASAWALRLVLGRAGSGRATLAVTARALEPLPADGVRAALSELRIDSRAAHAGAKTTARAAHDEACAAARARGAWEALLANERGELAEGSITNVYFVEDGALVTPPLASGCVAGVARGALLAELRRDPLRDASGREIPCTERAASAVELARAGEVLLTNSVRGLVPVLEVLGPGSASPLPGARGPVFRALRARFSRLEEDGARPVRPGRPRA